MSLDGQVALITGASRGLGREVARLLARRGVRLILTARGAEALREAAEALRPHTDVVALPGDIAIESHAERLVARGLRRFGRIDLLINNASSLGPTPMPRLEEFPPEALDGVFRINVTAPLRLIQLVLPGMRAAGRGVIINVTSDAGIQAYPGWGGYGATKAALEHISRTLAAELAGTGIRVYVVDPGDMNTRMHRDAEPGIDLSHLPGPEAAAERLVRLVEKETAPDGRFTLSSWTPHGEQIVPVPGHEGALQAAERVPR
ncbi:MAG TPA: SDR family oxidoreductase [bacterium]|nr:SDR family oxidoreductase [bacterium]